MKKGKTITLDDALAGGFFVIMVLLIILMNKLGKDSTINKRGG